MKPVQEPLVFEISKKGRSNSYIKHQNIDVKMPDGELLREHIGLPSLSEIQAVRHYTHLSNMNFGVDSGFYPLGSCTMKYNPKINEDMANLAGFTDVHPFQNEQEVQGALRLMYELGEALKEISGMKGITLIPAAGAHGESTGIKLIDAYHKAHGGFRKKIIIPDTAHGTNPASSAIAGHEVIAVESKGGVLKKEDIASLIDEDTAALMVTNPNTLGFFESDLAEIAQLLHSKGALLYCDGANTNAWMGQAKLGDMGVDVIQYNLHKTFSTPHGGGGPGSGPVVVSDKLLPYLPVPVVVKNADKYELKYDLKDSIGRIKGFYGNFLVYVKAYTYILMLGKEGVKKVSDMAVLNANYIKARLKGYYDLPFEGNNMHEVVFSDKIQNEFGVKTMDIAKRLLDHGMHPPTVYFPLVVHGAIMIEPTETEPKEELDRFCDVMIEIAKEAKQDPKVLHDAPLSTPVRRCDEVGAAKTPIVCFKD
jgi:glycine dehydrogenase subunit 2